MKVGEPRDFQVSVIVPAHNVAPYIERCLTSLLAQNIPLQVIVVNDGSTDGTAEHLREICGDSKHSVVVLEQQNRGLSEARNRGLTLALGEFVGFVDGDDWVDSDTFSTLAMEASGSGADVVIFNGRHVDHHTGATKPFRDEELFARLASSHSNPFEAKDVPDTFRLDTSACRRLYRRSRLESLGFRFPEGLLFEDVLAHFQLLAAQTKILLLNRSFYNYRVGHVGRITDRRDAQLLTVFEVLRLSRQALRAHAVSPQVWANFVWFQNWVLLWLASQINNADRLEFSSRAVNAGRRLPRAGVIEFQRLFFADELAQLTVALLILGWKRTFLNVATNSMGAVDRRALQWAGRLRFLAPWLTKPV